MNKEIVIVYQDCFTCGAKQNWGEKTLEKIAKAGVAYRKVSFASIEGQSHCMKAIANGIKSFPFVTDGENYAFDVESLLQAESEPKTAKKRTRRSKKTKKELKNGLDSES